MGVRHDGKMPADLGRGLRRFQAWRGKRKLGQRIPHSLWALAVRLAKSHGVSRTAAVLGLDFYGLKERVEAATGPPAAETTFVEVTPAVMVARQCRVELDNGSGVTMRVQLVGYDAADLEVLARGFWSGR